MGGPRPCTLITVDGTACLAGLRGLVRLVGDHVRIPATYLIKYQAWLEDRHYLFYSRSLTTWLTNL